MVATLLAVTMLTALGWPGAGYRHSDFFQFWAAPRLLLEGQDPYDERAWAGIYAREAAAPVSTPPPPRRHIYPLWTAVPLLPLGAVPVELAASVWVVAQLAAVGLALVTLSRIFALAAPQRVLLFGVAAGSQPLWLIVGGGNVTGFVLAAFTWALASAARRPVRAGVALALVALKPHPLALAVPALVLATPRGRLRIVAVATVTFAVLVAITIPFGPEWAGEWLAAALARQLEPTGSNATIWTAGRLLPGAPFVAPVIGVVMVIALVGWWRASGARVATLVAGAVAISVALAPHGWSYDQVLLLIPLAATLAAAQDVPPLRRAVVEAAAAAVFGLLPWALYALAHVRGGEEPSVLTPLLAFALLAAVTWRGARATPR